MNAQPDSRLSPSQVSTTKQAEVCLVPAAEPSGGLPMTVTRPAFSTPVLCIDDFLPEPDADRVLQECIDLKKVYLPGRVFDGTNVTRVNRDHRRNDAVCLDDVFKGAPERSDILQIMKARIWTEECRTLWHEGNYIFDVINYSTRQECVVSRHGNGEFFHKHQDTRRDHITYRLVTIVYFVNRVPEQFSGGALLVWDKDSTLKIEPRHNRAVVFPAFSFHEVQETTVTSEKWEDARFSVNYWIGFQ
jgi:hypothetical protein